MRFIRRWWWAILALLVGVAAGFLSWALMGPGPMPEALAALSSDDEVQVQMEGWLVFQPAGRDPASSTEATTGFLFYPGGRVDPRAYAPAARALAAEGTLVIIVPMPLNLAVFAPNRASRLLEAYPQVQTWGIGGHSLGGTMAARFALRHPAEVQGLVLWAAYPAGTDDLSRSGLAVTSIYGTRDGLVPADKMDASRELLPADTVWVPIEGGNHAQFGWYGLQPGDNKATISRSEQQERVIAATQAWLSSLEER